MNEENGINISNPGGIIYVNQNATGNNDGTSWDNAYTDLQSALKASQAEDQIWVAQGTYYPTDDGDRDLSFVIKNGIEVYGGFAGGETELSQRDWVNNQVTLSGNIGAPGDRSDNSYQVVTVDDTSFFTIFDGFTIVDGQADVVRTYGGGIYAGSEGNAELRNLIIANNFAINGGGGAYLQSSQVNLDNVAFFNNNTDGIGGGLYTWGSSGEVTNGLFINNRADIGGAIGNDLRNNPELGFDITNSTFVENQADSAGVINSTFINGGDGVNITNSIIGQNPTGSGDAIVVEDNQITINDSLVQGGFSGAGENIIDAAPLFVDPANNNYGLQPDSPAIDVGNNAAVADIDTDLVGNSRISNNTVDLGAYEFLLNGEGISNNPDTPPQDNPDQVDEPDDLEGDPVYRFFIPDTGVHFYTADEEERDEILETQPDYVLEGTPYNSAPANDSLTGVAPIYRFLNTDTGVRIYTISEAERESIETNLPNYESEGIAYYGYTQQIENTTPVFRFYNSEIDAHFYTSSTVERDSVIENLPNYQLESNGGIAFYVEPIFTSETPSSQPINESSASDLGEILTGISQVAG